MIAIDIIKFHINTANFILHIYDFSSIFHANSLISLLNTIFIIRQKINDTIR